MAGLDEVFSIAPGEDGMLDHTDPRVDAVESFVRDRLVEAGVPFVSDGLSRIRLRREASGWMRIRGRLWAIEQSQHWFWLDVRREGSPARVAWKLYFDVDPTSVSARRERHLIDVVQEPEEVGWMTVLTGEL